MSIWDFTPAKTLAAGGCLDLKKEETMFKWRDYGIKRIIAKPAGRSFSAYYFMPKEPLPHVSYIEFADQFSTVCFSLIFSAILSSDYQARYRAGKQLTVFDIIGEQDWRPKEEILRPLVLELTLYGGNRYFKISFWRDGRSIYSVEMDFSSAGNMVRTIEFLDDLLEENSSSAKNDIRTICREIIKQSAAAQTIIYTLRC